MSDLRKSRRKPKSAFNKENKSYENKHRNAKTETCPNYFKGNCKYGSSCRYSHPKVDLNESATFALKEIRALFSSVSLMKKGSQHLWLFLRPSHLLNWERFSDNGTKLESINQINCFVTSCFYALEDDSDQLLYKLGDRNIKTTLTLIENIIEFNYSVKDLSFQSGLVAFTIFLTHDKLTNHYDPRPVNAIFGCLNRILKPFVMKYISCLDSIIDSTQQLEFTVADRFVPVTVTQMVLPFVELIQLLSCRFQLETWADNDVVDAIMKLENLIHIWKKRLGGQLYDIQLQGIESNFSVDYVLSVFRKIQSILSLKYSSITVTDVKKSVPLRENIVWPCPLIAPDVPVHDNYFLDHSKIRIIPTQDEVKCEAEAVLPGNYLFEPNAHWLPSGPKRLLDTHFRLLREDMVGSFIFAMRIVMEKVLVNDINYGRVSKIQSDYSVPTEKQDMNIFVYSNAKIVNLDFHPRYGLCLEVQFAPPPGKTKQKQRDYWEKNKRLENGLLLSLMCYDSDKKIYDLFFGVVVNRDTSRLATENAVVMSLSSSEINISLLDHYLCDQRLQKDTKTKHYLVEANKILFETYQPILEALQRIVPETLPFQNYICPAEANTLVPPVINPPLYALGTQFDLSFLLPSRSECILDVQSKISIQRCLNQLIQFSTLDKEQCEALISALCSEIVFIQGPPGTGKSFVGIQIVLAISKAIGNSIGPILVLCYTNHALDQFLNHLLDAGIDKMVRLGSRTKDDRIRKLELANQKFNPGKGLWREYRNRDELQLEFKNILATMNQKMNWKSVSGYLETNHLEIYNQFCKFEEDQEGFKIVTNKSKSDILSLWVDNKCMFSKSKSDRELNALLVSNDIANFSVAERKKFVNYVEKEVKSDLLWRLNIVKQKNDKIESKIQSSYEAEKIKFLSNQSIIGATTTGASKNYKMLSSLSPRIMICEEAGEILESHILANLYPNILHFISIGDHMQLRPQISDYGLSVESTKGRKYRLDLSLFERMREKEFNVPLHTLGIQRRMRPSISKLITKTLYPELKDDESVLNYPPVSGMKTNLLFMTHDNIQDGVKDSQSHSNVYEAKMVVALSKYLLKQGYSAKNITILTPYLAQLSKIRKALNKEVMVFIDDNDLQELRQFEEDDEEETEQVASSSLSVAKLNLNGCIRVSTIDNYQGEECDIIIISLVRNAGNGSLNKHTIGFLKTSNRINVLLSRARHGMYLFGQASLLQAKSPMWAQVIEILRQDGVVSDHIPLFCNKHPDYCKYISSPEMFDVFFPNGGCLLPCPLKLRECGHSCPLLCHSNLIEHVGIQCTKPCVKLFRDCQHPCSKLCSEDCGKCMVISGNLLLPCGHLLIDAPCHVVFHPENYKCKEQVKRNISICGHEVTVSCFQDMTKYKCKEVCHKRLDCGHFCSIKCHQDNAHKCTVKCLKPLLCGHLCSELCHSSEDCPPCNLKCELMACSHSKCDHKCYISCVACAEECAWNCPHQGKCPMPCGVPCVRLPCDERCSEILSCGHQCPSICGEKCPDKTYCQICASPEVKDLEVDLIMFETYSKIDVNQTPIIVLECGHVKTAETLDGLTELNKYYSKKDGKWFQPEPYGNTITDVPKCPDCRAPIKYIFRYARCYKKSILDVAEKQFIILADSKLRDLVKKVQKQAAYCSSTPSVMIVDNLLGKKRLKSNDLTAILCNFFKPLINDLEYFELFSFYSPIRRAYENCISSGHFNTPAMKVHHMNIPNPPSRFIGQSVLLQSQCKSILFEKLLELVGNDNPTALQKSFVVIQEVFQLCDSAVAIFKDGKNERCQLISKFCKLENTKRYLVAVRKLHNFNLHTILGLKIEEDLEKYVNAGCEKLLKDLEVLETMDCKSFFSEYANSMKALKEWCKRFIGPFYETVTDDEFLNVFLALSNEFKGSGHWYTCPNGHLYTIGECGMSMQSSYCPECGTLVGGSNHRLYTSNAYAGNFEERMRRMNLQ